MSNPTYIHLDSRYRNRNEWPNPSEFEIDVNQVKICYEPTISNTYVTCSGGVFSPASETDVGAIPLIPFENSGQWTNPTSDSSPIYTLRIQSLSNPDTTSTVSFVGGTSSNPILNVLNTVSIDNYYTGYYIIKNPNNNSSPETSPEIRVINTFIASARSISMNQPFLSFNSTLDQYVLIDPSTAHAIISAASDTPPIGVGMPFTYIVSDPNTATKQDYFDALPFDSSNILHLQQKDIFNKLTLSFPNYYNGYFVYNVRTKQYTKIKYYNGRRKVAFLEKALDFAYNDTVLLTKGIPFYVSSNNTIGYDQNYVVLNNITFPCLNTIHPAYIYIVPKVPDNYPPYISSSLGCPPSPPPTSAPVYTIGPCNTDPLLISPSPSTLYSYLFKASSIASSTNCNMTYINVCGPIPSSNFLTSSTHDIVFFFTNKDSYKPVSHTLNKFPISEGACYTVQLLSLVLPNVEQITGSRIAFYPYVMVEFHNVGTVVSTTKFQLSTNNPYGSTATFIAPVNDTTDPAITIFTKISSYGMTQTMKFIPNEKLRFRVYLPDGTLFKSVTSDTQPPLPPNPILQITSVYEIKRV